MNSLLEVNTLRVPLHTAFGPNRSPESGLAVAHALCIANKQSISLSSLMTRGSRASTKPWSPALRA
eukprot:15465922-Alexandrium_andersonii.AAC.1